MKGTIKVALLVILTAAIIVSAYLWMSLPQQATPEPDFEMLNFYAQEISLPYGETTYQITFKLNNTGDQNATNIQGSIKFQGLDPKYWNLIPSYAVLGPGDTSNVVTVTYDEKPSTELAIISVNCTEGIERQFTETLPP